jgi:hypothetical protein
MGPPSNSQPCLTAWDRARAPALQAAGTNPQRLGKTDQRVLSPATLRNIGSHLPPRHSECFTSACD